MVIGVSSGHYRLLFELNADVMLDEGTEERKAFKTPRADWFSKQREAVGNTSCVHAMLKIASAEVSKQHGYDETGIDRAFTMNQWVSLKKDGGHEIASLETGGVLIGGTTRDCAGHVEEVWRRGNWWQLRTGGVQLLKLMSEMQDTCNTANAVVPMLARKKEENGKAVLGEEAWAALPGTGCAGTTRAGFQSTHLTIISKHALPLNSARNFRRPKLVVNRGWKKAGWPHCAARVN